MHLKVGTRGSPLALAQTDIFIQKLNKAHSFTHEIIKIKTTGDKILDKPLYDVGGKALFIKELEEALLSKQIDVAIHSLKDVPGVIDEKFVLGCYLKRDHPLDCLISNKAKNIHDLPQKAIIGSSSPRRAAFIKHLRPDLTILPLRGNINTRLNKLSASEFDAIILAEAGLRRLNLFDEDFCTTIPAEIMIPAVGQGIITSQILAENVELKRVLNVIDDKDTSELVNVERAFLAELNANCRTPAAGYVDYCKGGVRGLFMVSDEDMENMKIIDETFPNILDINGKSIARRLFSLDPLE